MWAEEKMKEFVDRIRTCNICGEDIYDDCTNFPIRDKVIFMDLQKYKINICEDCYQILFDSFLKQCKIDPLIDDDFDNHVIDIHDNFHESWGPGESICPYFLESYENITDFDYMNMVLIIVNETKELLEYVTSEGKYGGCELKRGYIDVDGFFKKLYCRNNEKGFISKDDETGSILYYPKELKPWFERMEEKYTEYKQEKGYHCLIYSLSQWYLEMISSGLENNFKVRNITEGEKMLSDKEKKEELYKAICTYGESIIEGKEYEGLYSVDLGLSFSADNDNLKCDNPENLKVRCINIAEDGTCLIECIGKNQYFIKLSGGYAVLNNAIYAIKGYLLGSYKLSHYEDTGNGRVLVEDPKQTKETLQKLHDSIEITKRSGYCGAMGNHWKRKNIEEIINGIIAAEKKQGLNSGTNN